MKFLMLFLRISTLLMALHIHANAEENTRPGVALFTQDNPEQVAQEKDSFLAPDEAFKFSIEAQDHQHLIAHFEIAPGHYLYQNRIKFELKDKPDGIQSVGLPAAEIKQDPTFGETKVFHHSFDANITLDPKVSAAEKVVVLATYQGCSEKGLCYAPIHKSVEMDLAAAPGSGKQNGITGSENSDDQASILLKSKKLWLIAAGFFGFGLLLAFTPCVLPMIPILSGIIVGDKKAHQHATGRLHSFNLSLAYTLGMALSYTLAGIAAGLSGKLLSNALQNPWALGLSALIFVILSFSMFGFYELRLPGRIETRMVNASNKLKGGQFLGVLMMGALSALIVSPCVAAPLAGALLYISRTHDVVLGGIALFALSLGMGVPLLLIGASAGHILPKTGQWMTNVRNFFGVLMLAVAVYIIKPLMPVSLQMMLWSALLIIPAIYLNALDNVPPHSSGWKKFLKGIGILLLLLGIIELVGATSGAKSPLQPLAGLRIANSSDDEATLPFKRVKNIEELESVIKASPGKTVMLDFYADWCVACKEMEQFTFSDSRVRQTLKNVVLLQADVTANNTDDIALLNRFQLFGPPGIIFFGRQGQELKHLNIVGYENAAEFLVTVNRAVNL